MKVLSRVIYMFLILLMLQNSFYCQSISFYCWSLKVSITGIIRFYCSRFFCYCQYVPTVSYTIVLLGMFFCCCASKFQLLAISNILFLLLVLFDIGQSTWIWFSDGDGFTHTDWSTHTRSWIID